MNATVFQTRRQPRPAPWCLVWRSLCISLLALLAATAGTARAADGPIIAFADVHGGMAELRSLLHALELIGAEDNWRGGDTRLVSLGDLLDRGPDSRQVMDLLMKLEAEAPAAGGQVHLVLGNHEVMNLTGDLRYVAAAEYAAFAADEDPTERARALSDFRNARAESETPSDDDAIQALFDAAHPPGYFGHRAAFRPTGRYGQWLLSKPQILVLEGTAFVHGGLSSHFAIEPVQQFNTRSAEELARLLQQGTQLVAEGRLAPGQDLLTAPATDPSDELPVEFLGLRSSLVFAANGPTWYRGTASCHALIEAHRFARVLAAQTLDRVVMGHTPTNTRVIQTRFDGRAILADTGMYRDYYNGRPSAVIIDQRGLRTVALADDGRLIEQRDRPAVDLRSGAETGLRQALRDALALNPVLHEGEPLSLTLEGRDYHAYYHREAKRQRQSRLAAQALDKHLGLGLVAPVVVHESAGAVGSVEIVPARSLTETARAADAVYRTNACEGSSDYPLMYALDGLLGLDQRNGRSLYYDRSTWLMYLTGQDSVFPTTAHLPRYLDDVAVTLPVLLAERLARLDTDGLEDLLGDYLSDRQIKAVLKRRDLLLEHWPVEE
jgi:hypothetical protein